LPFERNLQRYTAAIASQEDHKPAYFTQATALLNMVGLCTLIQVDP
jgi:hypothetical protein